MVHLDQRFLSFKRHRKRTVTKANRRRILFESLEDRRLLTVLTVDTLADTVDATDGVTSLREAIEAANAMPDSQTILFADAVTGAITLDRGQLEINDDVIIRGPGPEVLKIDANENSRVLNVEGLNVDVSIEGLMLTRGRTTQDNQYPAGQLPETTHSGGGIRFNSNGSLTLTRSVVSGNSTAGDYANGGGIATNFGSVTLIDSTLSGNRTAGEYSGGGGIGSNFGAVSLTGSTLSGNLTTGRYSSGGGIVTRFGNVTLTRSTLANNGATGSDSDGGAVWFDDAELTIRSSTITGNTATGVGGGIGLYVDGSDKTMTVHNSVISGNTDDGTAPNFEAPNSPATNLNVRSSIIGDATGTSLTNQSGGNQLDVDWKTILANDGTDVILADNGGLTQTIALIAGGPAVDAGDNALTFSGVGGSLITDQRGGGFARIMGGIVDIGALESSVAMNLIARVSNETDIVVVDGTTEVARFVAPLTEMKFSGGPLSDSIIVEDLSSLVPGTVPIQIDAGTGNDTLRLAASGQSLNLLLHHLTGIETIDIRGSGLNRLTASSDITTVPDSGTKMRLMADAADELLWDVAPTVIGNRVQDGEFVVDIAWSDSQVIEVVGTNWTNPAQPADVDGVGGANVLDALLIINQLSRGVSEFVLENTDVLIPPEDLSVPFPNFYDVSRDGKITALDVLQVINTLANQSGQVLEQEHVSAPVKIPFPKLDPANSIRSAVDPRPIKISTAVDTLAAEDTLAMDPAVQDKDAVRDEEASIKESGDYQASREPWFDVAVDWTEILKIESDAVFPTLHESTS